MRPRLLVGLMSGTSADGIDAALVRQDGGLSLVAAHDEPLPTGIKSEILALSTPGDNEIVRLGTLDTQLGQLFATAVHQLLRKAGVQPEDVAAIGSHGQTVRHHPPSSGAASPFTLQIGDPNQIAELTGITTVADFRRRDIAAGGEGAPLVPAFHQALFGKTGQQRAIVNIGGIANVTLLDEDGVSGFDTGPGNTLLDQWVHRHLGKSFDEDGAWAAEGQVNKPLLKELLSHDYFSLQGPKSTGKETFNLPWLEATLSQSAAKVSDIDVQATLAELTATAIASALSGLALDGVYVCGGGAANTDLMRRLYRRLKPVELASTAALGCDPDWVEAVAFAWLAGQRLDDLAGNVPAVTGASGDRVLGGIYPGK